MTIGNVFPISNFSMTNPSLSSPDCTSDSYGDTAASSNLVLPSNMRLHALEKYSFSDQAARMLQAAHPSMAIDYHGHIDEVWGAVESGEYGLIPIENSSGGIVWPHLDHFRSKAVRIVGEANLQVSMCAGGVPGSDLSSARHVYSHQKGLDQCRTFIRQGFPVELEEHPMPNTAMAAKHIGHSGDPESICLSSRIALQELNLNVLAEDVADLPAAQNITQFFMVHQNPENHLPFAEAERHAALVTPENRRGVLGLITSMIANARVDLTSLHSRAIGEKQYTFYVEMQREGSPRELHILADQLDAHPAIQEVKWLGSWNLCVDSDSSATQ